MNGVKLDVELSQKTKTFLDTRLIYLGLGLLIIQLIKLSNETKK